jgi:hypothetical protein
LKLELYLDLLLARKVIILFDWLGLIQSFREALLLAAFLFALLEVLVQGTRENIGDIGSIERIIEVLFELIDSTEAIQSTPLRFKTLVFFL